MTDQITTSTDLVVVETLVPTVVFAPGGVRTILDKLKADVRAIKRDISTPKGRAAVKSLAFKVARSKTALDEMGKDLVADLKKQTGAIDLERRVIRDELDALKVEVLSELEAYEADEAKRIKAHEDMLAEIAELAGPALPPLSSDECRIRLGHLDEYALSGRDWQEFIHRAIEVGKATRESLEAQLADAVSRETAEAEALKLAAEQEAIRVAELARLQAEHEAEIARAAAEEAKRAAEQAAQREAERVAEIARLEKQKIEDAAIAAAAAAKRAQDEADERAAQQERERLRLIEEAEANERRRKLEIEMAETARLAAERQKEREVAQAIENERQRLADVQKRLDDEAAARAKDVANKKRVNGEIKADLMALGLTEALAVAVITGVVKGQIRNVTINY